MTEQKPKMAHGLGLGCRTKDTFSELSKTSKEDGKLNSYSFGGGRVELGFGCVKSEEAIKHPCRNAK